MFIIDLSWLLSVEENMNAIRKQLEGMSISYKGLTRRRCISFMQVGVIETVPSFSDVNGLKQ